ncbi:MAG: Holliday junction resolvase RuvX [Bacteroidota bacterium]
MGRILAIDYGRKRVGLAVTDELKIIATALGTVRSGDVIAYLKRYLRENTVECFVVGEPKDMANRPSEAERFITPFVKNLKKNFPGILVERFDERFTSRMATQAILAAGVKKSDRQNKSLVDAVSATMILQSYLESLTLNR